MRIVAFFENVLVLKQILRAVITLRIRENVFFLHASRLIALSFNLFHNSFLHMFFLSNNTSLLVAIKVRKKNAIMITCPCNVDTLTPILMLYIVVFRGLHDFLCLL